MTFIESVFAVIIVLAFVALAAWGAILILKGLFYMDNFYDYWWKRALIIALGVVILALVFGTLVYFVQPTIGVN